MCLGRGEMAALHCQSAPPWNVAVWKLETPRTSLEDKFYIFLLWKLAINMDFMWGNFQFISEFCRSNPNVRWLWLDPLFCWAGHIFSMLSGETFHCTNFSMASNQAHQFQEDSFQKYHRGFHLQFQGSLPYSTILNHPQPSSTILNHTQPLWNFFDLWIFMDIKLVKLLKIIGNSKITSIIHISLHFSNFFGRATRPLVHQIRPVFDACSMTNGVPHIIYTYIYIYTCIYDIYMIYIIVLVCTSLREANTTIYFWYEQYYLYIVSYGIIWTIFYAYCRKTGMYTMCGILRWGWNDFVCHSHSPFEVHYIHWSKTSA